MTLRVERRLTVLPERDAEGEVAEARADLVSACWRMLECGDDESELGAVRTLVQHLDDRALARAVKARGIHCEDPVVGVIFAALAAAIEGDRVAARDLLEAVSRMVGRAKTREVAAFTGLRDALALIERLETTRTEEAADG